MKKLSVVLFVLVLICAVSVQAFAAELNPATVTIWHTFTEGQKDTLEAIAAEFSALYDGVEVVVESQPYDGFEAKVYEAVSNGTGPDIIFNYASTMADYVDAGLAADIAQYMSTDYASRVSAGVYEEGTSFSDNSLHAIAIQSTGPIFFYNKTIFDELGLECPKTWDEIEACAKKIYEEKGIAGFAFDSLTDGFQSLAMQSGAEYVDLENRKVLYGTEEFAKWVEWFADGVKAGYFSLAPTTGNYFSNDMCQKQLASYIGSSAGIPYLDLGDDELATAPFQQISADSVQWVPAWNRSALIFKSNPDEEAAATAFIEFFTNAENNFRWVKALNAFSPYADTQALPEYQEFISGQIALLALGEQVDHAYVLPSFPGANTVRNEIKALVEKAATGQMSAEEAIAAAVLASEEAMNDF